MLRDLGEIPLFFKIGEEPEKIKKTLNLLTAFLVMLNFISNHVISVFILCISNLRNSYCQHVVRSLHSVSSCLTALYSTKRFYSSMILFNFPGFFPTGLFQFNGYCPFSQAEGL